MVVVNDRDSPEAQGHSPGLVGFAVAGRAAVRTVASSTTTADDDDDDDDCFACALAEALRGDALAVRGVGREF